MYKKDHITNKYFKLKTVLLTEEPNIVLKNYKFKEYNLKTGSEASSYFPSLSKM